MYSSVKQDEFILGLIGHPGYFVDVGAGDGIHASNTLLLEQSGWTGLCIDGCEENYLQLIKNRKCDKYFAVLDCIERSVEFISQKQKNCGHLGLSGISEYYPNADHKDGIINTFSGKSTIVQTEILHNVLQKMRVPKDIDLLDIDVEGAEYAILQSFLFDLYNIQYILVEVSNYKLMSELLYDRGYKVIHKFINWPDILFEKI